MCKRRKIAAPPAKYSEGDRIRARSAATTTFGVVDAVARN
jgi:hypothetical protein